MMLGMTKSFAHGLFLLIDKVEMHEVSTQFMCDGVDAD